MKQKSKLNAALRLLSWIYHDGLKQHTKQAIAFVILSGAGVGMQLGAFISAAYYARVLEHNRPFDRFGIYIQFPRQSIELLIAIAGIIAIALISSAALSYFARWLALKLSMDYEERCTHRVLDISKDLPVIGNQLLNETFSSPLMVRLASSDARVCGKMLRICLLALFPAAVVLLAAFILFTLNWMLTLFLMAIIPLGAIEYLNINRRNVKTARSTELSRPALSKSLREYFNLADPILPLEFKKIKENHAENYVLQIMSGEQIRFLTQILTAISLSAVILFFGMSGLQNGTNLTYFVLYLLVLRYGMNNLLSLITITSNLSSHYPALKRYREFIETHQQLAHIELQNTATLSYYCLSDKQYVTSLSRLGPIVVLSPERFSRQSFAPICGALNGQGIVAWSHLLQKAHICESEKEWLPDEILDKTYGKFLWYQNPTNTLSEYFTLAIIDGKLRGGSYGEIFEAYQLAMQQHSKDWIDDRFEDEDHSEE